jgi:hypothetical protein
MTETAISDPSRCASIASIASIANQFYEQHRPLVHGSLRDQHSPSSGRQTPTQGATYSSATRNLRIDSVMMNSLDFGASCIGADRL